jgi:hypothetical protein
VTAIEKRSFIGGLLLVGFGLIYVTHSVFSLELGTFAAMGPGMFPALVGAVIVLTGGLAALTATRRHATAEVQVAQAEPLQWRALGSTIGAMSAFALLLPSFGLVPAITMLTSVQLIAFRGKVSLPRLVGLPAALAVLSYLIFVVMFRMPIPLFKWPFA